ncbi:hypothetical protein FISHEDRAFT_75705 [Fistulina hepatica ATCC 64428]|uniref:Uncharacterized protein n=1 Tax=Fistulina hepatica ATCC 64428 TaxID=1128425 RepID=A0A0D7A5U7_9AGAR|nr:hypothetical protein FISHEDRAFT_75705 [Fistulina hepatica ATCC 64428]
MGRGVVDQAGKRRFIHENRPAIEKRRQALKAADPAKYDVPGGAGGAFQAAAAQLWVVLLELSEEQREFDARERDDPDVDQSRLRNIDDFKMDMLVVLNNYSHPTAFGLTGGELAMLYAWRDSHGRLKTGLINAHSITNTDIVACKIKGGLDEVAQENKETKKTEVMPFTATHKIDMLVNDDGLPLFCGNVVIDNVQTLQGKLVDYFAAVWDNDDPLRDEVPWAHVAERPSSFYIKLLRCGQDLVVGAQFTARSRLIALRRCLATGTVLCRKFVLSSVNEGSDEGEDSTSSPMPSAEPTTPTPPTVAPTTPRSTLTPVLRSTPTPAPRSTPTPMSRSTPAPAPLPAPVPVTPPPSTAPVTLPPATMPLTPPPAMSPPATLPPATLPPAMPPPATPPPINDTSDHSSDFQARPIAGSRGRGRRGRGRGRGECNNTSDGHSPSGTVVKAGHRKSTRVHKRRYHDDRTVVESLA